LWTRRLVVAPTGRLCCVGPRELLERAPVGCFFRSTPSVKLLLTRYPQDIERG
jgi:hypothetical protein